ncbi:MAG: thioredoxin [Candidatus Goldbacteria bacterium]|nr:thioredoxin [Candidatus Goldiibacteriota bacterium]
MSVVEISEKDFEKEVLKSDIPVLVDFWAPWCGPCKMIAPIIEKIEKEYNQKMKFLKVDIDSNPNIASEMGIRSIPTLIIFKNGDMVEQVVGVVTEIQLKKIIDKVIENIF